MFSTLLGYDAKHPVNISNEESLNQGFHHFTTHSNYITKIGWIIRQLISTDLLLGMK